MSKGASLRRVDVQAKLSLWLSVAAAAAAVGPIYLLYRGWRGELKLVIYHAEGYFIPAFYSMCGLAVVLAAFALGLGFNSAGQRRNEFQRASWLGFFLGAGVLALTIIFLVALSLLGQPRGSA